MPHDVWQLAADLDDFSAHAGALLRSRPVLHNTALTDIETLRTRGAGTSTSGASLFGRLESDGEVRAVFYRTPRGHLRITPLSAERAGALAAHLAALGHSPAGVVADHDTAAAFAAMWQQHTGSAAKPFWRAHLYRLDTLTPPKRTPEGQGRAASKNDHAQLVRWCREFCVEVAEHHSINLIDSGAWADSRFSERHFTVWETPDGTPVSMAAATPMVAHMVRVDPVYTPADRRGRATPAP